MTIQSNIRTPPGRLGVYGFHKSGQRGHAPRLSRLTENGETRLTETNERRVTEAT